METLFFGLFSEKREKFKSYYVVWKPVEAWKKNNGSIQFKSYYVVWKQRNNTADEKEIIEFKSYYVVWKRENEESTEYSNIGGLNRTM